MTPILQTQSNAGDFLVNYTAKDPSTIDSELVEALASGGGPDAVIIPDSKVIPHQNIFLTIPFSSYPERTFKDAFVDDTESLVSSTGIRAIPLLIDPLVMYWNRDLYSAAGVVQPPKLWSEFYTLAPKISTYDSTLKLSKSLVALGDAHNVPHFKQILLTLAQQAGGPDFLNAQATAIETPLASALRFYTQFSNPSLKAYSWNTALPNAQNAFLSSTLATYFGFASELPELQRKNANLNFDMAPLPQTDGSTQAQTYGTLTAYAIVKSSKLLAEAFNFGVKLSGSDYDSQLSRSIGAAPIRRDLLSKPIQDAFSPVVYAAAIAARGWLDPSPEQTDKIFTTMVDDAVSNRQSNDDAASRADDELQSLLSQTSSAASARAAQ